MTPFTDIDYPGFSVFSDYDDTGSITSNRSRSYLTDFKSLNSDAESVDEDDGSDPKPVRGGEIPNPSDQESARMSNAWSTQTPI